jgi:hypothetical protein
MYFPDMNDENGLWVRVRKPIRLMNQLAQSGPPDLIQQILSIPIPRKVNNKGLPLDFVDLDETPKTAILTIVTVVSHNK